MSHQQVGKNCVACQVEYFPSLESQAHMAFIGHDPCCPICRKINLDQRVEDALQESVNKLYALLARRQQR
jgi:hypothetical protein